MKPNQANTVISKLQKNNLLFSSHSVFSFWLWQHEQTNIFYLCPLVSIDIPTNFQVCLFLPKTASCFSCTTLSLKETEWKEQITTDLRLRLCQGSQARQVFFFFFLIVSLCVICTIVSNSLQPHGLQPTSLLCPWNSPGKNTGVGSHSLLQGIFLTQGSNSGLLHCRQILYHLSHLGTPSLFICKIRCAVRSSGTIQMWT